MINRRDFIKASLIFAGGALIGGCDSNSEEPKKVEKIGDLDIDYLRQMVTSEPATSRRIMWQTNDILINPSVEVREVASEKFSSASRPPIHASENFSDTSASEAQDKTAPTSEENSMTFAANENFFTDDDHMNNQYTAQVEGLEAGKKYEYRIVDGDHCSDWHDLKTLDGSNFKMLLFPDSQCADYSVWEKIAKDAYARNPDADFFVNIGDLVDNGEDWTQWRSWFHGASLFLDKIFCVPVMGNHECYSRQWKVREPAAYLNYFELPKNGSKNYERHYYSFDYGDVHFAILDSQWDELEDIGGDAAELIREQKEWLRRDISSSQKKWKIVLTHKDVLQYRIHGRPNRLEGFSDIGLEFMPLFDELDVDIVFTGHLHTYRDRGHIFNFEHNNKGPLYILTGIAGDVRYPGLWIDHALDVVTAPQPETDNYLTVEVSSDDIFVKCFLPDGKEIDRAVIIK